MASVCPKTSVCASVRRSRGEQRGGITPRCPMSPSPGAAFPWPSPHHCQRERRSTIHPCGVAQGMPLALPNEHLWVVVELSELSAGPCPPIMLRLEAAGTRTTCPGFTSRWVPSGPAPPACFQHTCTIAQDVTPVAPGFHMRVCGWFSVPRHLFLTHPSSG